jgi:uncharacterized protein
MKPLALSEFLSSAFDAWYTEDNPDVHVILFEELLRTLLGGAPITDAIGSPIPDYLVIDTDGSIQSNDVFKVCDEGVAESGLTVLNSGFDDNHGASEIFQALISGQMGVPTVCKSCPEEKICGGGYLPHRYSRANGFNNPSVWCADLLAWIGHVREVMKQEAA